MWRRVVPLFLVAMQTLTFQFLDVRPMVDGELELVEPALRWVEPLLAACNHPLTRRDFPEVKQVNRSDLLRFIEKCPRGRQRPDTERGLVPAYHYWMRLRPEYGPPIGIAGGLGLRIASTPHIELYAGHIGYHVYPPRAGIIMRSVRAGCSFRWCGGMD